MTAIYEILPNQWYAGGKLDEAGWHFVASRVHVVLNLRTVPDLPPFDMSDRMLIWTPIRDKVPPGLPWVISVSNMMNELLDAGFVLYVHDTAGINRLGFMLTACYMQRFRVPLVPALAALRRIKPDLHPKPGYMALLAEYEKYLRTVVWPRYCHGSG